MYVSYAEGSNNSTWKGFRRPVRVIVAVLVGLLVLAGIGQVTGFLHKLNPFAEHTTDSSQPALLLRINNLHEYRAASGHYEVVVEMTKSGGLPTFVHGEKRTFLGVGDVPADIDFSKLGTRQVTVSGDRRTATIALPDPTLGTPQIDTKQSHVISDQRGVLDRVGSALSGNTTDERDLYQAASTKMSAAAAADDSVRARAETNTRAMLQNLLRSLGFTKVTVTFAQPTDAR